MKIRAIVEFWIEDEDDMPEPELEKFIEETVTIKSGEYQNLYSGSIVSAEEVPE